MSQLNTTTSIFVRDHTHRDTMMYGHHDTYICLCIYHTQTLSYFLTSTTPVGENLLTWRFTFGLSVRVKRGGRDRQEVSMSSSCFKFSNEQETIHNRQWTCNNVVSEITYRTDTPVTLSCPLSQYVKKKHVSFHFWMSFCVLFQNPQKNPSSESQCSVPHITQGLQEVLDLSKPEHVEEVECPTSFEFWWFLRLVYTWFLNLCILFVTFRENFSRYPRLKVMGEDTMEGERWFSDGRFWKIWY